MTSLLFPRLFLCACVSCRRLLQYLLLLLCTENRPAASYSGHCCTVQHVFRGCVCDDVAAPTSGSSGAVCVHRATHHSFTFLSDCRAQSSTTARSSSSDVAALAIVPRSQQRTYTVDRALLCGSVPFTTTKNQTPLSENATSVAAGYVPFRLSAQQGESSACW